MVLSGECPLTYNKHGREVDREKVVCRRDQTFTQCGMVYNSLLSTESNLVWRTN